MSSSTPLFAKMRHIPDRIPENDANDMPRNMVVLDGLGVVSTIVLAAVGVGEPERLLSRRGKRSFSSTGIS
jgi:hypothetical protein